jgi:hypothetical protein
MKLIEGGLRVAGWRWGIDRKGMKICLVELPVGVGLGSSGSSVLVRQLLGDQENFWAPGTKEKRP